MLAVLPLIAFGIFQRPSPMPVPAQDNAELAAMEQKSNELIKEGKYPELMKGAASKRAAILKMIEEDRVGTAKDFLRASALYDDSSGWYEARRSQHEYALMALALGETGAPSALKRTWDFLMASMGQRPRFGFMKPSPQFPLPERLQSVPPPPVLQAVFDEPERARSDAKAARDNAEIKQLREADQALRSGQVDFNKLHEMASEEAKRRQRVRELLVAGVPKTGADYEGLSLVMQHGDTFDDFKLAHELSMASLIVGYDDPWLVTATYDRMLLTIGQRQRFGTQFNQDGLRPMDPIGINDRMRLQFRLPKLVDLKAREQEVMKKTFGGGQVR
ncbi:MAG TPA: hypothetical protein VK934_04985 [Fimbriimonas sp.]|nr:hypothetical protein [Fimbriimonas sp.]